MAGPLAADLRGALQAARARRAALFEARAAGETTAFRLLHGPGDGVPGLYVDVAGDWAVAHLRDAYDVPDRREAALDAVAALGFRGVYEKRHPRRASGRGSRLPEALAPTRASRGDDAPSPLLVREAGVAYHLELGHGLSLGLFFDQRDNRRWVRGAASGGDVLNLFAYTCGFGVAAAAGGATRTTNVDVARRALEVGRANYAAAGIEASPRHRFFREDALRFVERARRRGDRFDLICVDPPTFATTPRGAGGRRRRFTSGRDWVELADACVAVLAPGGTMLASSNDERLSVAAFRRLLLDGAARAGAPAPRLTPAPPGPDYPPPAGGPPHLKAFRLALG